MTIGTITETLSTMYTLAKMMDPKPVLSKQPDGKTYEVDRVKLRTLCIIFPHPSDSAHVVLKPSSVHGRGVFVTKNIPKDTLITFHAADITKFCFKGNMNENGHAYNYFCSDRFNKKFNTNNLEQKELVSLMKRKCDRTTYSFDLNKNYRIIGHPDFDENPWYLGHFINDGAKCDSTPESIASYVQLSMEKTNCKYQIIGDKLHVAVIATRNIIEGEELFTPYGPSYWSVNE